VSQAVRGAEGRVDSHDDLISSNVAGQVDGLLSEAQLSACWAGIVANLDPARRIAARFVSKQNVEDIVHSAAVLFVEDAQRSMSPEPFPANEDQFRRKFLTTVRNHALDCVRDSKPGARPVHSHWGIDPEPELRGHNLADRELDTLFARNDHGEYDAPAPTVRRARDDLDGLHYILRCHMEDLSQTQREIIEEAYFQQLSRNDIAARHGISLNTYDNHRKAACRKLRDSMMAVVDFATDIDLPDWYDRIEEMNKRHAARQRRRASRKKVNRSNSGGDRSNFEGDRSNFRRDADKNARARDLSVAVATKS
jgi:DNA-directed RNA polymerase specialized sigma24 family protein